ncbi:glycoside hydrolase family 2 TIM barrel-domain containing protein [Phaeodactylibacter luteus]|uniref:Endo-1,3-beta-glucanase btgC n=1 Tax=Phaeodactylibacter luteus TaxID=1564516 RepID=A0A5C6RFR8_9BACT|nr:glycoside hydrolase family 2 TIM barrel-domain containing protein [Phaeodactylibacter luteus]TXB60083.1 glycosyl hydrolase [Phaeodactylibacter luteus]
MDAYEQLGLPKGRAICYSGFRQGQHPGGQYPSYEEVREDLLLLQGHWKYLRLFDCDAHAETVLKVIAEEGLDFQVMQSAYIEAEMNNFNCPWGGGVYSEEKLEANKEGNQAKIERLIAWANRYPDLIFSLSVGNEACVDWTDHYVPQHRVAGYAEQVKAGAKQPVTFCENYVPWLIKLDKLAAVVDFISIHTYPVWEYKHINEALDYTKENYYAVAGKFPDKPVVITEAGWATKANGRGINPENVSEAYQKIYFEQLMAWVEQENIFTFFFEAFDEDWKGSAEPLEPEKHWGLFYIDRTPKPAVQHLISPQPNPARSVR